MPASRCNGHHRGSAFARLDLGDVQQPQHPFAQVDLAARDLGLAAQGLVQPRAQRRQIGPRALERAPRPRADPAARAAGARARPLLPRGCAPAAARRPAPFCRRRRGSRSSRGLSAATSASPRRSASADRTAGSPAAGLRAGSGCRGSSLQHREDVDGVLGHRQILLASRRCPGGPPHPDASAPSCPATARRWQNRPGAGGGSAPWVRPLVGPRWLAGSRPACRPGGRLSGPCPSPDRVRGSPPPSVKPPPGSDTANPRGWVRAFRFIPRRHGARLSTGRAGFNHPRTGDRRSDGDGPAGTVPWSLSRWHCCPSPVASCFTFFRPESSTRRSSVP